MEANRILNNMILSKVTSASNLGAALLVFALSMSLGQAQSYFYDDAGRLIQVAYAQGSGFRYGYDDADNLTSVTPVTLPPAPVLVSVTRTSSSSVQIVWQDGSNRETGYPNLWRNIKKTAPIRHKPAHK